MAIDDEPTAEAVEQTERLQEHLDKATEAIEAARAETQKIAKELRFPLASSTRLKALPDAKPRTD